MYTKGEWKVYKLKDDKGNFDIVSLQANRQIAKVYNKANAQLISAAPDLLRNLKELVSIINSEENRAWKRENMVTIKFAQLAINKAEKKS